MNALKNIHVDEVIVYAVDNGAIMGAWATDQKVPKHSIITLMGDPHGSLTRALGMELTHDGPVGKLGPGRCKRNAIYLEDGVVRLIRVSEKEGDPAGDDFPEETLAEAMIEAIKADRLERLIKVGSVNEL